MKVALIGMPNSGKTAVAEAVQKSLGAEIIDDYAEEVEGALDLVSGLDGGGYIFNLAIALERISWERTVSADNVITCGSLLETSVYTALEFELTEEFKTEEEKLDDARRVEATLKTLACLYMDTFHYDAVFYLPPVVMPDERRWQLFDQYLQAAFAAFFLVPVIPLIVEGETVEEATAKRVEIVTEVMKGERTVESLTQGSRTKAQTAI